MDAIDSAFGAGFGLSGNPSVNTSINNLADGLAIVANGNTHAAITSGQYVYVRNHGSLSEGLYKATTNISANATLSGSNLTADSSGGLNSVYASINSNKIDGEVDDSSYFDDSKLPNTYKKGITLVPGSAAQDTAVFITYRVDPRIEQYKIGNDTVAFRHSSSNAWGNWQELALNSSLKTLNSLTAGTGVTIVTGGYIKAGKIVVVSVRMTTTQNLSTNSIILGGLPAGTGNGFIPYFTIGNGYEPMKYSCRLNNNTGDVYLNGAIPSGETVNVQGTYIANS